MRISIFYRVSLSLGSLSLPFINRGSIDHFFPVVLILKLSFHFAKLGNQSFYLESFGFKKCD